VVREGRRRAGRRSGRPADRPDPGGGRLGDLPEAGQVDAGRALRARQGSDHGRAAGRGRGAEDVDVASGVAVRTWMVPRIDVPHGGMLLTDVGGMTSVQLAIEVVLDVSAEQREAMEPGERVPELL